MGHVAGSSLIEDDGIRSSAFPHSYPYVLAAREQALEQSIFGSA
jgi:hypothetical protein